MTGAKESAQQRQSEAQAITPRHTAISRLVDWLNTVADERGMTKRELAGELDVTYGYLMQLQSGVRDTRNISDELAQSCARFLGVPRIAVLVASGQVSIEDFADLPSIRSDAKLSLGFLNAALDLIRADPAWGIYLPLSVKNTDPAIQQFIIMAYEQATGRVIIPKKLSIDEIEQLIGQHSRRR